MSTDNSQTVATLNDLIRTCLDSQRGYNDAAEAASSSELKQRFHRHASERASFAGDLQQQVRSLGGEPADSGSTGGAIHRAWLTIRQGLSTDEAILKEVDRGEEHALDQYREALEHKLPKPVEELVRTQLDSVVEAHAFAHAEAHKS